MIMITCVSLKWTNTVISLILDFLTLQAYILKDIHTHM